MPRKSPMSARRTATARSSGGSRSSALSQAPTSLSNQALVSCRRPPRSRSRIGFLRDLGPYTQFRDDDVAVVLSHDVFNVRIDMARDRKSTRLNSSHANISYAVFCLK